MQGISARLKLKYELFVFIKNGSILISNQPFAIVHHLFQLISNQLFNQIFYSHHNTTSIFEELTTPDSASNTQKSFIYTVGAGIKKLNPRWQIGVGYEFANWNKSRLGRAEGQTENSGLALSHLYINGVLFNIT